MSSPTTAIRLITDSHAHEPGLDAALSAALLQRVDSGEVGETLRLYRPGRVVAFGRQDVASAGYRQAVAAARAGGFDAVERLAGGRAAVFTPRTLAFGWAIPDAEPRRRTEERFAMVADLFADALTDLGIDARVGEVPGEYCPGRFSVNAGGTRKLMGVGQRLKRRAAHVGGVLVVGGAPEVNAILDPVYGALGLAWDPAATGAVEDLVPGITVEDAAAALVARVRRPIARAVVEERTLDMAREMAPTYLSP